MNSVSNEIHKQMENSMRADIGNYIHTPYGKDVIKNVHHEIYGSVQKDICNIVNNSTRILINRNMTTELIKGVLNV